MREPITLDELDVVMDYITEFRYQLGEIRKQLSLKKITDCYRKIEDVDQMLAKKYDNFLEKEEAILADMQQSVNRQEEVQ